MKKHEQAFILRKYGQNENTSELNSLLDDGWSVNTISPMSGGGQEAFALVILEKEE